MTRRRKTQTCSLCAFENGADEKRCAMCGASLAKSDTKGGGAATKDMLWLLHEAQRRGGNRDLALQALQSAGARA